MAGERDRSELGAGEHLTREPRLSIQDSSLCWRSRLVYLPLARRQVRPFATALA
jgi:hypothetical protein